MKIVIEIPDEIYGLFKYFKSALNVDVPNEDEKVSGVLIKAILNGTILPKNHGRLIDADATLSQAWQNFYRHEDEWEKKDADYIPIHRFYDQNGFECCQQTIVNAPTVIEAEE